MSGKDYYQILGVSKSASPEEIKSPTVSLPSNTILIETREIKGLRPNSKKSVRPMRS